ncbi:uncharacterized protein [Periplaneta americana]|uniref:uncharacterized protein isoform X3 n=1 Tax=Periplaneta americana TaxID=6978 RepID=UPI0037E7F940
MDFVKVESQFTVEDNRTTSPAIKTEPQDVLDEKEALGVSSWYSSPGCDGNTTEALFLPVNKSDEEEECIVDLLKLEVKEEVAVEKDPLADTTAMKNPRLDQDSNSGCLRDRPDV